MLIFTQWYSGQGEQSGRVRDKYTRTDGDLEVDWQEKERENEKKEIDRCIEKQTVGVEGEDVRCNLEVLVDNEVLKKTKNRGALYCYSAEAPLGGVDNSFSWLPGSTFSSLSFGLEFCVGEVDAWLRFVLTVAQRDLHPVPLEMEGI